MKMGNTTGFFIKDVERCIDMPGLRSRLQKKGYRLKMGTDVTFHMLRDDYQTTIDQLKSIRDRPTKFICLNDDMKSPSTEVRQALRQLLEDLWPLPSTFELPITPIDYQGDIVAILHVDDVSPHLSFLLILFVGSILIPPLFLRISGTRARRKNN
jgi:UDP-N-acetylglucosamine-lysosomal-enzyme